MHTSFWQSTRSCCSARVFQNRKCGSKLASTGSAKPSCSRASRLNVARLDGPKQQGNGLEQQADGEMARKTLIASIAAGTLLGILGPFDEALPQGAQVVSASLGWSYFAAWTISFYPQVRPCCSRRLVWPLEWLSIDEGSLDRGSVHLPGLLLSAQLTNCRHVHYCDA